MAAEKKTDAIDKKLKKIKGGLDTPLAHKVKGSKVVWPEYGFHHKHGMKKPCKWTYKRDPPKGFIEMEMVGDNEAASLKIPSGPALRLCFGIKQKGVLVSVKSPEEAMEVGRKFRECNDGAEDSKTCAFNAAKGTTHQLGRAPSRRRKARR